MQSINYALKFLNDREKLIKNYPNTWGKICIIPINGLSVLEIPSPQLLAAFSGYLKYQYKDIGKVYFRGETNFHKTTIPSLFRYPNGDIPDEIRRKRIQAFEDLVHSLPDIFVSKRFKNTNFSPLLQHYGIKTYWVDLVDNLFIALWFSNKNSNERYSYIKFFDNKKLHVENLREKGSSLTLRPHCQHGLSVTKKVEWNSSNLDFSENMVAIVRLQNNEEMKLSGYIFSCAYMFPNAELDNTYKLLKGEKFQKRIDEITSKYDLPKDALGRVT